VEEVCSLVQEWFKEEFTPMERKKREKVEEKESRFPPQIKIRGLLHRDNTKITRKTDAANDN